MSRIVALALAILVGRSVGAEPTTQSASAEAAERFRARCAALAAEAEKADRIAVEGKDGWLFFGNELHHFGAGRFWGSDAAKVSRAAKPEYADPLPAILDFQEQLDKLGIKLLIVPVPPKLVIYPDKLPGPAGEPATSPPTRLDILHQEFYKLLRQKGVDVLDVTVDFLAARPAEKQDGPVYCMTDTHWSSLACRMAAKAVARRLAVNRWVALPKESPFTVKTEPVRIAGDLSPTTGPGEAKKESLEAFVVRGKDGAVVATDPNSPVLVLGDSHTLVFHGGQDMHAAGAGLADHLAVELGLPVDLIGVKASGATEARIALYRNAAEDKDWLGRKKVIIWCFGAREFTEADGWRKVPVVKR
jgi:alginate O-acetyltransferase complex protein AlgJ